ncbi:MAG: insulinase family protein [Elusimicrobia bacterium]|nr:insulinase family protein [Elusimicrobiota bacterium]
MTALLLAVFCASGALGQAPKRPDMSREPAVGPVRAYQAPAGTRFELPNGIGVLIVRDRRFPLVTARVAVRGGGVAVGPEDAGLAEALAEMLTEGAAGRSARQIAEEADAIGGEIGARAEHDFLVVEGFALSDKVERLLTLLADVALRPDFPPSEVELRRKNMLDELNVNRSQPSFLGRLAFYKKVYARHPYAITAPTEASIARLDRDRLKALHARLFNPKSAFIVLVGDVDPTFGRRWLAERFAGWSSEASAVAAAPAVELSTGPRRVYLLDRPGSAQTAIYVGNRALTERDPDYFPALLANQVLGGSFAARLMQDLREKKGYTYGVRSRLTAGVEAGAFLVGLQVRTEVTAAALSDLLGHLDRIRAEAPAAAELAQAKSYLAGSFTRRLETQAGVADALLHGVLHRLPAEHLDRYVGRVQAVTPEQALAAAEKVVRGASAVVIAVGDGAKIKAELAKFSTEPVQVLTIDGD